MGRRLRYGWAWDVCLAVEALAGSGLFDYLRLERLFCVWSCGSRGGSVARVYGLPGPWVFVAGPGYVVEVVAERFYRLDAWGRLRVVVHELLHIPRSFGGGLRGHDYVTEERVRSVIRGLPRGSLEGALWALGLWGGPCEE